MVKVLLNKGKNELSTVFYVLHQCFLNLDIQTNVQGLIVSEFRHHSAAADAAADPAMKRVAPALEGRSNALCSMMQLCQIFRKKIIDSVEAAASQDVAPQRSFGINS